MKHLNTVSIKALTRRARAKGFVIGYILVGIALISAVVAALVAGNKNATNNAAGTTPEQARLQANLVLRAASDTRDAALRFVASGSGSIGDLVTASAATPPTHLTMLKNAGMGFVDPTGTSPSGDLQGVEKINATTPPTVTIVAGTTSGTGVVKVNNLTDRICAMVQSVASSTGGPGGGCSSNTYTTGEF